MKTTAKTSKGGGITLTMAGMTQGEVLALLNALVEHATTVAGRVRDSICQAPVDGGLALSSLIFPEEDE